MGISSNSEFDSLQHDHIPTSGLKWRLALLIVTGALAATLVISGVGRYQSAKGHSQELMRAEVFSILLGARREIGRNYENRQEILSELLEDLTERGAGYLAVIDDEGNIIFSAGVLETPLTSVPRRLRIQRQPRIEIMGDGDIIHAYIAIGRGGGRRFGINRQSPPLASAGGRNLLALEFRSISSQQILQAARGAMFLELGAALLLMIAAIFFWRMSRKAEALAIAMVTQRLETQQRLEHDRQLKALGQMSAVLGHELRNPITALKGHAQLLLENLDAGHVATRGAEIILSEVVALQHLTGQVLSFAKTGEISLTKVYLDDLAHGAVAMAGADPIKVNVPAEKTCFLDRDRMTQVLVNLLRNARQSLDDSDPVLLDIELGDVLEIKVSDTGLGIQPGYEEKIFEPFVTTRAKGTGLGLSLARRIIESHGGNITACNNKDGGAVFTIVIPREAHR